jgi:glycosyltransferase involved in cell wall biosynthesis
MTPGGPPRIKVLYVSHVGILGGAERSLLDLIAALDLRRFDVRAIVPGIGDLSRHLRDIGIASDFCPSLQRLRRTSSLMEQISSASGALAGAMMLRALVTKYRPAIVHANSTTAALYALCLPLPSRAPTLWHVRDLTLPAQLARILASRCSRIIVPSSSCHDLVSTIAASDKIVKIPNGIQVADRHGQNRSSDGESIPNSPVLVATIGQLVEWKGHATTIEVARRVVPQCPNVHFLIVADDRLGPAKDGFQRLCEKVHGFGLSGNVTVSPFTDDVGSILSRTDILLHPAFPEPFGRVVVEAMAAECPVVAYQGPHGPAEIVRHGIDGFLVAPQSPDSLANAVVRLAKDPLSRRQMGAMARARVIAQFDRKLMAQRMQDLYESLVPDPATGAREHPQLPNLSVTSAIMRRLRRQAAR